MTTLILCGGFLPNRKGLVRLKLWTKKAKHKVQKLTQLNAACLMQLEKGFFLTEREREQRAM